MFFQRESRIDQIGKHLEKFHWSKEFELWRTNPVEERTLMSGKKSPRR